MTKESSSFMSVVWLIIIISVNLLAIVMVSIVYNVMLSIGLYKFLSMSVISVYCSFL